MLSTGLAQGFAEPRSSLALALAPDSRMRIGRGGAARDAGAGLLFPDKVRLPSNGGGAHERSECGGGGLARGSRAFQALCVCLGVLWRRPRQIRSAQSVDGASRPVEGYHSISDLLRSG